MQDFLKHQQPSSLAPLIPGSYFPKKGVAPVGRTRLLYSNMKFFNIFLQDLSHLCQLAISCTDADCSSVAADTVPVPRLQAFTANPLMVSGDIAKTVMEEMLTAHKQYLPRFF